MRTHGAVVGRRFRSVTKLTTKVRIGRGYLWRSFLIAAAALKTPARNGYNAQGVSLNGCVSDGNAARYCSFLECKYEDIPGYRSRNSARVIISDSFVMSHPQSRFPGVYLCVVYRQKLSVASRVNPVDKKHTNRGEPSG